MVKSIPNILTMGRMVIIPIILALFYFEPSLIINRTIACLFLVAAITDFLDGYIARTWEVTSAFGRFFDPIADKLLVASVILMLVHFDRIDIIPALLIVCREILVSGLRENLAEVNVSVPVSNLGKVKTFVQMAAIVVILLGSEGLGFGIYKNIDLIYWLGRLTIWIAAILTLVTGYVYFKKGLESIPYSSNN